MWCILMGNCLFCCLSRPPSRNSLTSCPYDEDWKSEGLGDRASDPFPVCDVAEGTPHCTRLQKVGIQLTDPWVCVSQKSVIHGSLSVA